MDAAKRKRPRLNSEMLVSSPMLSLLNSYRARRSRSTSLLDCIERFLDRRKRCSRGSVRLLTSAATVGRRFVRRAKCPGLRERDRCQRFSGATRHTRRSADFQSAVSPASSRPIVRDKRVSSVRTVCGLEIRDTADWKSALPALTTNVARVPRACCRNATRWSCVVGRVPDAAISLGNRGRPLRAAGLHRP